MAKVSLKAGTTSYLARIFIQDSSSATGAGLTGLVFNSAGLSCYRSRDDDGNVGATAMTLVTATRGTWTSLGFVEKDATNQPGVYELGIPNAALAAGSKTVLIMLKGAANMAPLVLEIELTATDNQDAVRGGITALPNAIAGANGGLPLGNASGRVDVGNWLGSAPNALQSGRVDAYLGAVATGVIAAGSFAANALDAVWSTTTRTLSAFAFSVTVGTNNDKTGYGLSAAAIQAIWDALTSALTTVGSIGKRIADFLTGDAYVRLGAPAGASVSADIAAVKTDTGNVSTRLTAARAGYLDNLNVGGNVASSAEVTAIQNNTRSVFTVPEVIERPDSGTEVREVHLYLYDEIGNMEAPDSAPTLTLTNQAGTDRSSRLDSTTMALVATGHYKVIYTASVGDALEQLLWQVTIVEGGATRTRGGQTQIVDTTAASFTSSDRTNLGAIKTVTDALPNAGALTSLAQDSTVAKAAALATAQTAITAIRAVTDLLPNGGALSNLDAAISTRATPAQVLTQVNSALDATSAEVSAVPAALSSLRDRIAYMFAWRRNKKTQTATTMKLRNDGDTADIASSTVSDDGTTLTVGKDA